MTRTLFSLLGLFHLVACTDYDFQNLDKPEDGVEDTGIGSVTDGSTSDTNIDTGSNTPDDPINETDDTDCSESLVSFDIEQVSTLQDAVSYAVGGWTHDAVTLHFDDSSLAPDQTWRVSAIEILVLIPDGFFPYFPDGEQIHVQIFDSHNPLSGASWTMSKSIVRSEHQWNSYTLPYDAYYSSLYAELQQQGAWVRFDTSTVIPNSGMSSTDFITGIMWTSPGIVKVGYSNFNQDCGRNWTNYGDGWVLNGSNPNYYACSWPMMRVEIEVITPGDCE